MGETFWSIWGGGVESDLGPKKIQNFEIEIFFYFEFFSVLVPEPYLISARVTTLSALRTVALRHIYLISLGRKIAILNGRSFLLIMKLSNIFQ